MAEGHFGIQLFHGHTAPRTVELARRALAQFPVHRIWLPDHFGYEHVFVTLAALGAQLPVNLATAVTNPFMRNPVDLAAGFSALAHLAVEREVVVGIGASAATSDVIRKKNRPQMVRETILMMRELFAGRAVHAREFPQLADFFNFRADAPITLRLPPAHPLPIYVAAAGEQMLGIAGELGDGLIISNFSFPMVVVRRGALTKAMAVVDEKLKARNHGATFHKSLHWHVSVSKDGHLAKQFARHRVAMTLGTATPQELDEWGVPQKQGAAIQEAFGGGLGVEEMGPLVSQEVVKQTGLIVAGDPEECVAEFEEALQLTKGLGFDSIDFALPLGPRAQEAIDLLAREVIPAVDRKAKEHWRLGA